MGPLNDEALQDIQGWIVSGLAHLPTSAYVFLRIHDAAKAKAWLRQVTPEVLTAELWQRGEDGRRIKPRTTLNLAFTHAGLEALGLPEDTLQTFPAAFLQGMPARAKVLGDIGDSAPENWELGGPGNEELHALMVLQGPDEEAVALLRDEQLTRIESSQGGLSVVAIEGGTFTGTEHFGFADGISNPFIEGTKGHVVPGANIARTGEFILGYWNDYDLYPAGPAVPRSRDPDDILSGFPGYRLAQCKDLGRSGSFLVYRKLKQDVPGFWNFIADQVRVGSAPPDPATMTWLAAKFFGRWPSGTPLVLSADRDDPSYGRTNDYSYYPTDKDGLACPIGAHTRRSNPIDSITNNSPQDALKTTARHRIMRRAVYFGEHIVTPESFAGGGAPIGLEDDGKPRGMHLFAINADIERQFEFVMQSWCNLGTFNGLYDEKDPVIGSNDGSGAMRIAQSPLRRRVEGIPRFVSVAGGSYLFLPGIAALRFLAR